MGEKKNIKKKVVKKKKKVSRVIPKEKILKTLNPKQEKFCRLYACNTKLFGNATMCYATAYGYDLESLSREAVYEDQKDEKGIFNKVKIQESPYDRAHQICRSSGFNLLTNSYINDRVNELLRNSLTDEEVDTEIAWVVKQREELGSKMSGIKEYNKLKARIKDKKELEITGLNLKTLYELVQEDTDEEDD